MVIQKPRKSRLANLLKLVGQGELIPELLHGASIARIVSATIGGRLWADGKQGEQRVSGLASQQVSGGRIDYRQRCRRFPQKPHNADWRHLPRATSGGINWRGVAILGAEAQSVAVAWQVYSITHRPLDLGLTGLALFLPGLLFLLPAGHAADRFDRRQMILVCYGLQMLCTRCAAVAGAVGLAQYLRDLWRAVFYRDGAGIQRAGQLGAGAAPGSGRAFCECGDLGRGDLSVCQCHRDRRWEGCCSRCR